MSRIIEVCPFCDGPDYVPHERDVCARDTVRHLRDALAASAAREASLRGALLLLVAELGPPSASLPHIPTPETIHHARQALTDSLSTALAEVRELLAAAKALHEETRLAEAFDEHQRLDAALRAATARFGGGNG